MKGIKEPTQTEEIYIDEKGKTKKIVYSSYVVVLTEKDGANVKAVRIHTTAKKGQSEMIDQIEAQWPDWNIKSITRLYEDDFRK